jgi:hypothetical protein
MYFYKKNNVFLLGRIDDLKWNRHRSMADCYFRYLAKIKHPALPAISPVYRGRGEQR